MTLMLICLCRIYPTGPISIRLLKKRFLSTHPGRVVSRYNHSPFCESDHVGDKVARRSRTGILLFVNRALVNWVSKKQNSVETSTFGSEFMGLKTAMEMVIGLRYKLRMMGVPIEGPTRFCVDNMSVVNNTSMPSSTLKKKSNAIAYHFVREKIAARVGYVTYEPTDTNLADILTKQQSGPERTQRLAAVGGIYGCPDSLPVVCRIPAGTE